MDLEASAGKGERMETESVGETGSDDSGFEERSPQSPNNCFIPPSDHKIDQWHHHITLENFAKDLQNAAKSIYPNETRSRYSEVYVLILKWETEDPKLPVSCEIAGLMQVFQDVYHYDIKVFEIPDIRSHARVSEKINTFIGINDDSGDDLKIVYYAGHSRLSKTRDLVWTR
jgi:hypothetical protein